MAESNEKMVGTIIRLFPNRGFGFVRGVDGVARFMHASEVIPREAFDTMREGQGVKFISRDVALTDKQRGNGLRATQVEVIS